VALKRARIIRPDAIYRPAEIEAILGLAASTLSREFREGRLRMSKRAGRHWLMGAWVISWLAGGEYHYKPQHRATKPTQPVPRPSDQNGHHEPRRPGAHKINTRA
jgi:hypothetical protein